MLDLAIYWLVALCGLKFAVGEWDATVTAAAQVKREARDIEKRSDFIGYWIGPDNTWSPRFCYGFATTWSDYVECCTESTGCEVGIGCKGRSYIATVLDTPDKTMTRQCGQLPPRVCNSAFVYEKSGDPKSKTMYGCDYDPLYYNAFTVTTIINSLDESEKVAVFTPTLTWEPPLSTTQASRSTRSQETSLSTSTSASGLAAETGSTLSNGDERTSSLPISGNNESELATDSSISTSTTTGDSPLSSSSSSTQRLPGNSEEAAGSSEISKTEKVAIGVGVGLGVPLIGVLLAIWLFPNPLKRFFDKKSANQESVPPLMGKQELSASTTPQTHMIQSPQSYNPNAPYEVWTQGRSNELWTQHGISELQVPHVHHELGGK